MAVESFRDCGGARNEVDRLFAEMLGLYGPRLTSPTITILGEVKRA